MIENRRIRFATIYGIDRMDLPLAAEIWIDDLRQQSWVSRDIVKVATVFKRYLVNPDPERTRMRRIESGCQLDRKQVAAALSQMHMYGAIEAYSIDDGVVCASLNLTILHRLKVLETFQKFAELQLSKPNKPVELLKVPKDTWIPATPVDPDDDSVEQGAQGGASC
ncbi:MAG: hypothetical protein ACRBCJ_14790 [Hyphomicrobiaceae bacterium]